MDRRRAPAAVKPDRWDAADDPDEIGVFAAERYFYGDDALWCGRSSSSLSLSSSAFRTGTLEHARSVVTAGTSSSEASWNSRSALLPVPIQPSDDKLRAGAGVATPVAEAEPCSGAESGRDERRRASSSSNSNLRRWLLAVAGCVCARDDGDGDGEESVSADETEAAGDVPGAGGKKCNAEASELSPETEMIPPEPLFEEATAVTVRAGSGRWLLEGDEGLAGMEAFSPIDTAGHGRRRAANSVELPMPAVLHPAATASSGEERRRVKSFEKFRPPLGDQGSALGPATQSSAFTIVAGNARRAARQLAEEAPAPRTTTRLRASSGARTHRARRASSGAWSPRTARRPATSPARLRAATTTTSTTARTAHCGTPRRRTTAGGGEAGSPPLAAAC